MMKKYLFMLAAFIAATATFTACSSEEDVASAEQDRGIVKTQFTISFPQKAVVGTRMSAGVVQIAPANFRGVSNMRLFPFNSAVSGGTISDELILQNKINLLSGGVSNTIADASFFYTGSNSHLYQDVDVPMGTKSFLFYGQASTTTGTVDPDISGKLVETPDNLPAGTALKDIRFSPSPIVATAITTNSEKIEAYLTDIAYAEATHTDNSKTKWSETSNVGLRWLYEQFISMHAGSLTNVKAAVSKLYDQVKSYGDADTQEIKDLKDAIAAMIKKYGVKDTSGSLDFTEFTIGDYPADNGLPDGAAYLNWQSVTKGEVTRNEFVELTNNDNTGLNMASFNSYAYPASLYYTILSGIRTSNKSEQALYTGEGAKTTWDEIVEGYTDANLTKDTGGEIAVTSKTRSIAIVNPVQYAVARVDVTLKAEPDAGKSFVDSKNNVVTVSSTNFKVTGVLIGSQCNVDWQFHHLTGTEYTLYDNIIKDENDADIYLTSSKSKAFYTLALETIDAGQDNANKENAKVPIAIELLNNTTNSFYGKNEQIIYPGCKFYLVGTIDPSLNTTKRYGDDAVTTNPLIKKAFTQDYTSTLNLTIKSFKDAYNVLPDLSLPKLELGLSVDLGWTPGIELPVVID